RVIREARRRSVPVISGERSRRPCVSSVSIDNAEAVDLAFRYLTSLGRKRLALYSVNPASNADPDKAEAFAALTGSREGIFTNNGLLSDLFARIEPRLDSFDGIVCTNGYAALSLVRHLKESGRDPVRYYIVSLSHMNLFSRISPSITEISADTSGFGPAVYAAYRILSQKENAVSSVNVFLKNRLTVRESTECRQMGAFPAEAAPAETPRKNSFFTDSEIRDSAKLETLLSESDDADLSIVDLLLSGRSVREIAEICYLSETAVKYRLKNMRSVCAQKSREDLIRFLRGYLR
ncbi:MAG: substrate-binding domain-containing protein, partial [Clostridia bacterium]|nr:substrate-binding domain-containing protein [Clostridia bacterium]